MYRCLTYWHMFRRLAFPLVVFIPRLCRVTVFEAPSTRFPHAGSLKFHLIFNLETKKARKRKQDNRTESWRWISKSVNRTLHLIPLSPRVPSDTADELKPPVISSETRARLLALLRSHTRPAMMELWTC